jgi:hypothetical protein
MIPEMTILLNSTVVSGSFQVALFESENSGFHTSELAIGSMYQIDSQQYLHFFLITGYIRLYKTICAIKGM